MNSSCSLPSMAGRFGAQTVPPQGYYNICSWLVLVTTDYSEPLPGIFLSLTSGMFLLPYTQILDSTRFLWRPFPLHPACFGMGLSHRRGSDDGTDRSPRPLCLHKTAPLRTTNRGPLTQTSVTSIPTGAPSLILRVSLFPFLQNGPASLSTLGIDLSTRCPSQRSL